MNNPANTSDSDSALTVYYDRSCPICRFEIEGLNAALEDGKLRLVDCSERVFADKIADRDGVDRAQMMAALHVRDRAGHWYRGTDAFAKLYAHSGLGGLARIWGSARLKPVLDRIYAWIARNRGLLNRSGLPRLYARWVITGARRRRRDHARNP